jgi:hypothetical protein
MHYRGKARDQQTLEENEQRRMLIVRLESFAINQQQLF